MGGYVLFGGFAESPGVSLRQPAFLPLLASSIDGINAVVNLLA